MSCGGRQLILGLFSWSDALIGLLTRDHCGTWQHGEKEPVAISVSVETVLTSLGVHGSTLWETLIQNRSLEPDWLIESNSITYRLQAWPRALTLTARAKHTVPREQRPQIPTGCFPLVFYPIFVTLFHLACTFIELGRQPVQRAEQRRLGSGAIYQHGVRKRFVQIPDCIPRLKV